MFLYFDDAHGGEAGTCRRERKAWEASVVVLIGGAGVRGEAGAG